MRSSCQNLAPGLLTALLSMILCFTWLQTAKADLVLDAGPQGAIMVGNGHEVYSRGSPKSAPAFPTLMRQVTEAIQEKIAAQTAWRRLSGRICFDLTATGLHIELREPPGGPPGASQGHDICGPSQIILEIIARELARLPSHLVTIEVHQMVNKSEGCHQPMIQATAGHPVRNLSPHLEDLISKYADSYGLDPALVKAVMRCESRFNPGAVSPKGAMGLMQLMPATAAMMGVKNPFDPGENIAGGTGYLRHCLDRFRHKVDLALAAYNAGPEQVAKYGTIPPFQETRVFVQQVLAEYGRLTHGRADSGRPVSATAPVTGPGEEKISPSPPWFRQVSYSYVSATIIDVRPRQPASKDPA
jgi:hypothetical protein